MTLRRASALALVLLAGCVQVVYGADNAEEPVPPAALARLQPGTDDLGSCLQKLGAPHFVWEYLGDGMALAWASNDASGWGVGVSYSFEKYHGTSLSMDWADSILPGVVLWFGPDLRLQRWKSGRMRDLVGNLRRRPAFVDGG